MNNQLHAVLMKTNAKPTGIAVSTDLKAGGWSLNHAEGIVVTTDLKAGDVRFNHAEGIVVTTGIVSGAGAGKCNVQDLHFNHAEGIVVTTRIVAGPTPQSKRITTLSST